MASWNEYLKIMSMDGALSSKSTFTISVTSNSLCWSQSSETPRRLGNNRSTDNWKHLRVFLFGCHEMLTVSVNLKHLQHMTACTHHPLPHSTLHIFILFLSQTQICCYTNGLKPYLTSVRGVMWSPCSENVVIEKA